MNKLRLSQIWIYPVKSLPGIRLKEAELTDRGLALDRRWMLTDSSGKFITQRQYPQLSQFDIEVNEKSLLISPKDDRKNICSVPLISQNGNVLTVNVWDDQMEAIIISDKIDKWFSTLLGFQVHMVYMPDETKRSVNPKYAHNGEIVSFADGYPLLLIGQSSLDDLNTRLHNKADMKRFRPNLVIEGGLPYEEDHWKKLTIGESVQLVKAKPCSRCVMVNINPDTGEKGVEVLKTLSEYRRVDKKVMFGQNLLIQVPGILKEGASVQITGEP